MKYEIRKKDIFFKRQKKFPFSPKLKRVYINQRNLVTTLVKKAKVEFYKNIIAEQNDPRKLWNIINEACGKAVNKAEMPNKLLTENSQILTNTSDIATEFNKFFTEIGPKLASAIPESLTELNIHKQAKYPEFKLLPVEQSAVLKEIKSLNEHKAEGVDGIPARLVKLSATHIAPVLTHIVNLCIKTNTVPINMKCAKVLPIYKSKGDKKSCNSYRPISILPIYSKIFEKIINAQLQHHLKMECILSHSQFGFQKKKGTTDALIEFANQSFQALNNGNAILGLFLDFSKAFDTINHPILLRKLEHLNFSTDAIDIFNSYLTDRNQRVEIDGIVSDYRTITCGVPQGSILGPTLFLLYINDLANTAPTFKTILFADDTNLFYESRDINRNVNELNSDLNKIGNWCMQNKLTINIEKTNLIVIKNHQNRFKLTENICIHDKNIVEISRIKFLGVTIDPSLNWSSHIDNLRSQMYRSLGLIYHASSFLPTDILILLYNCLINSKIIYCIEAWGSAPQTHLNKILMLQKRLVRIIFHKGPMCHSAPLFKKSKILPVNLLYNLRISLLGHKAFHSVNFNPSTPYITRHSLSSLPLPSSTSSSGHRQVTYQVAAGWNALPLAIRNILIH